MLTKPNIFDPSDFEDIFTVVVVYVLILSLFVSIVEGDSIQTGAIAFSVVVLAWCLWAVRRVLERKSDDLNEEGTEK